MGIILKKCLEDKESKTLKEIEKRFKDYSLDDLEKSELKYLIRVDKYEKNSNFNTLPISISLLPIGILLIQMIMTRLEAMAGPENNYNGDLIVLENYIFMIILFSILISFIFVALAFLIKIIKSKIYSYNKSILLYIQFLIKKLSR